MNLFGLSEGALKVWKHPRWKAEGWEPNDIKSAGITELVTAGFLRIADGRCGFEAFKDSMVVPTTAGKIIRELLVPTTDRDSVQALIGRLFAYSHEIDRSDPDYETRVRDLIDAAGLVSEWKRISG